MIRPYSTFDSFSRKIDWTGLFFILLGGGIWIFTQFMEEIKIRDKVLVPCIERSHDFVGICLKQDKKVSLNVKLLDLDSKLQVSLLPKRIDAKEKEAFEVSIRNCSSKVSAKLGETVYLKKDGEHLFFTKEKTPFWISLEKKEENFVQILVEADLPDFHPLYYEVQKKTSFPLEIQKKTAPDLLNEKPLQILSSARWWGRDLLSSFVEPNKKNFHHVTLDKKGYLISEKDNLIWDSEKWVIAGDKTEGFFLAHIKKIKDDQICVEIWDETGKRYNAFSIPKSPSPSFEYKGKTLVSKPRLRSSKRISCQVGSQRIFLCEKDWVVQEAGRWKVLSKSDQTQYLKKAIEGEVFIFESIEDRQDKKVLIGKLLNSTHTQIKEINIPLPVRDRVKRSNRKNTL